MLFCFACNENQNPSHCSEGKEMVTTVKDVIKAVLDGVKVREPSYGKHTVSVF